MRKKVKKKEKRRKEREGNERINLLRYHDLHLYIRKLIEKICLALKPQYSN